MRGGAIHNQVLVGEMTTCLASVSAVFSTEVHVAPGRRSGYVDILAFLWGLMIVIEAETTPRRVWRDLAKATQLEADLLLVITPSTVVRRACETAFAGDRTPISPVIKCLTLGSAKQLVTNRDRLMTLLNVPNS